MEVDFFEMAVRDGGDGFLDAGGEGRGDLDEVLF